MAGVGKMLKEAAKMQKKLEALQEELGERILDVSSGGGAIQIQITAQGDFKGIAVDSDFLQEDKDLIESALLAAVQEAVEKAREVNDEEVSKVSGGFNLPF